MQPELPAALIVDDEVEILDFVERCLRGKYKVTRASNASEALDKLSRQEYEVLITDNKMPAQTGLEFLSAINGRFPKMARLLLSGYAEKMDIESIDRNAIHVPKPIARKGLLAAIELAMGRVSANVIDQT